MIRYIGRRALGLVPVLFLASIAVWAMAYTLPGDPVLVRLGPDATEEQIELGRERFGFNDPIPVQYGRWLGGVVLHSDLGESYLNQQPVAALIGDRLPATIQLAILSLAFAVAIAVPLVFLAIRFPKVGLAKIVHPYNSLAVAIPSFWAAVLLIIAFSLGTGWFPGSSSYIPFWENPIQALYVSTLPALSLGISASGVVGRFLHASLSTEMSRMYIRAAHARGAGERRVIFSHALRNASLPAVTVLGLQFGAFLGGAIITESIFNYPGLGRLILTSIQQRDYAVVQGAVLVTIILFVLTNLIVDALYSVLDPRVRDGASAQSGPVTRVRRLGRAGAPTTARGTR